ncbi:MAG: cob(I)yrinic acid a,c-diamide adenosyltransferase [Candidatus Zixiibacteriota bacterium]|nr:MAG: cob(I)yrinic acid a,c-diamide adenosyltransferase [candidate division Zixibacteria bacterium]
MGENDSQKLQETAGLLMVYTGNGKGKTTASLGMAVRAVGYDWKVCIVQFIKGSWKYGELDGIKRLEPNVELHVMGKGFVGIIDDDKSLKEHRSAARNAYETALKKMLSNEYQLVVLDELNVAVNLNLITRDELEELVTRKPANLHLLITGRGASQWLIDQADLVTEMTEIKHPYQQGIQAQQGVDF